ncbi:hypothetical protein GCM10010404_08710 [Nonomuraea africana]
MHEDILDAGGPQPCRHLLDIVLRAAAVDPRVAQPQGVVARALRPRLRRPGKLKAERDCHHDGERDYDG